MVMLSSEIDNRDTDGYGCGVNGVLSYFIKEKSLDASLGYTSVTLDNDYNNDDIDLNGFDMGVGLSIYLN